MQRVIAPLLLALLASVAMPWASAAAAEPVPVAHWAFDEASGTTILDQSGNGHDGSIGGQITRIDDGVYDRALRLHSASTTATASGSGLTSESLTVSLWVRGDEQPSTGAVLVEKGARDCDGASYGLYVKGSGLEVRMMRASGDIASFPLDVDVGLWDGEWHHVSFTYTWFVSQLRVYVDGTSWGWSTFMLVINETDVTSHDLSFGTSAGGSDCGVPAYIGDLDDIRIYDRELDVQQLGALERPIPTTTTLTARSDVTAYQGLCWTATVDPAPTNGTVLLYERLGDGSEIQIGYPTNDSCSHGGPAPPEGTYLIRTRFDTKGTHHVLARFIPGNPWLPSESELIDQPVAGVPTTTYLQMDLVAAGDPISIWAGVAGSDTYLTGSISLYDTTSGTPSLIETKEIPFTGAATGNVTFALAGRATGTYQFEARYSGTPDVFAPSSTTGELVVGPAAPDTVAPTATAPGRRLLTGTSISAGKTVVRLWWSGSDALSGVARYELGQSTDGSAWTTVSTALTSPTLDRPLAPGHTYRFRVRAVDNADNVGAWAYGSTFSLVRYSEINSRIHYSGTWTLSRSSVYWGGQAKRSSGAGAKASITVTARTVEWVGRKGPTYGKAQVYVNGVLKATVDLYASTYQNQRVVWTYNWSSATSRTITIKVLGTSGRPRVDLDAIVAAN